MPGLGVFSIAVNSVLWVGKIPIFGGLIDHELMFFFKYFRKFFNHGSLKKFLEISVCIQSANF